MGAPTVGLGLLSGLGLELLELELELELGLELELELELGLELLLWSLELELDPPEVVGGEGLLPTGVDVAGAVALEVELPEGARPFHC